MASKGDVQAKEGRDGLAGVFLLFGCEQSPANNIMKPSYAFGTLKVDASLFVKLCHI